MSTETERDMEAVEHLDFVPMCVAKETGCRGRNRADYLVVGRYCCHRAWYQCNDCVQRMVSLQSLGWACGKCDKPIPGGRRWLDTVTLHPLGGTP